MECMFQAIRLEAAKTSGSVPPLPPLPRPVFPPPPNTFAPGLQELARASSRIEPTESSPESNDSRTLLEEFRTVTETQPVEGANRESETVQSESLPPSTPTPPLLPPSIGATAASKELRVNEGGCYSVASDSHTESEDSDDDKASLADGEVRSVGGDSDTDASAGKAMTDPAVSTIEPRRLQTTPSLSFTPTKSNTATSIPPGAGATSNCNSDSNSGDSASNHQSEGVGDENGSECSFRSRHETYEISKSPYSTDERFEWDEDIFAAISQVLTPVTCPWLRQSSIPSEDANKFFGKELANDVIKFCDAIESTGMAYSPLWMEGQTINGQHVPRVPGPIMLICLWEAKISGADSASVQRMVLDLGVYGLVADAILEWNMENEFPGLRTILLEASKSAALRRKLFSGAYKLDCQLCAIFVARAFQATQILQRAAPESRLCAKVRACLDMMADHISTVDSMSIITSASVPSSTSVLAKERKKRGRRPKNGVFNSAKRRKSDASHSMADASNEIRTTGSRSDEVQYLTPTPKIKMVCPAVAVTDSKKTVFATADSCDSSMESVPSITPKRVQLCSNEDGSVLVTFGSLKKASAATEMNRDRIKERISEGKVAHKEFFWRYEPKSPRCVSSPATPSPKPRKRPTAGRKRVVKSMSEDYDDDDGDEDYAPTLPPLFVPSSLPSNYQSSRPIEKLCTKTGRVLGVFETQSAACEAIGVSRSFFCQRMKSAPTTFSGYIWRWAEETPNQSLSNESSSPHKQPGRPGKTVEKCSLETGAVVATFGSLRKAAKSLGISNTNFGHMMKHAPVEHEGYMWRLTKL